MPQVFSCEFYKISKNTFSTENIDCLCKAQDKMLLITCTNVTLRTSKNCCFNLPENALIIWQNLSFQVQINTLLFIWKSWNFTFEGCYLLSWKNIHKILFKLFSSSSLSLKMYKCLHKTRTHIQNLTPLG